MVFLSAVHHILDLSIHTGNHSEYSKKYVFLGGSSFLGYNWVNFSLQVQSLLPKN